MSFKFNKKAVVTGVSSVEAGKLLVYAQTVKKISSENGCSLDGNIFCVDLGAAALKKQAKKERRWLEEEADNAKITPGTIITVNGKERYVKTEVCDSATAGDLVTCERLALESHHSCTKLAN